MLMFFARFGCYIILSNISKGTAFHHGAKLCRHDPAVMKAINFARMLSFNNRIWGKKVNTCTLW